MINQVVLVGRTTKDIQLAYTTNNKAYAKFTLAVNRPFKDGQGNQQADFIRIVVWNKKAENAAKFVKKGDLIGVTGRIETGSYDDNGITRYTTDVLASSITFLESKKQQSQAQHTQEAGYNSFPPIGGQVPDFESTHFNPYDPSFSTPPTANYNNPFDTATARAGQVKNEPLINITDDDLPF